MGSIDERKPEKQERLGNQHYFHHQTHDERGYLESQVVEKWLNGVDSRREPFRTV